MEFDVKTRWLIFSRISGVLVMLMLPMSHGNADSHAKETKSAGSEIQKLKNTVKGQNEVIKGLNQNLVKMNQDLVKANSNWNTLKFSYWKDWYDHNRRLMKIKEDAFKWQSRATGEIHNVVWFMVILATLLSFAQVVYGLFIHKAKGVGGDSPTETMELSANKVKIATSVSGFLLLIITFAFFYIYIKEVYTLKPEGGGRQSDAVTTVAKPK